MSHTPTHDAAHAAGPHGAQDEIDPLADYHPHVVPVSVLLTVFGILLILTVITVAVTKVDLGKLNIWVAMAIAVVKAGVVAFYFMHLKYDRPFHGVILVVSLGFVALFIASVLTDSNAYKPNQLYKPAISEMP